jgi:spermidine/putrescine transport system substrate-binding protein
MVILKDSPQPDLAHAFINFLYEAPVSAANTEFVCYLCPNSASYPLLSETIRGDPNVFMPKELIEKSEVILDLGAENAKYTKIWDEIKAAK